VVVDTPEKHTISRRFQMHRKKSAVVVLLTALFIVSGLFLFTGSKKEEKPMAGGEGGELFKMTVIFPRSLEVLDDYYINVAWKMKYFEQEGLDVHAEGALGTTDASKLVAEGQGEVALPAPPVLFTAVANGLPIKDVFQQDQNYIFGFGVRKDSDIKTLADLRGKTISVGDVGWTVLIDPLLKTTVGFTTDECEVVSAGPGRAQLVAAGKADAVFTWEKEYQLWEGQGIDLRIIRGYDAGVRFPGNGHVFANKFIEEHPDKVAAFSRAWAKGIYYGTVNPAAATEITLEKYPMLGVTFEDALKAIKAGVWVMNSDVTDEHGYGYHEFSYWKELRDILYEQGTIPAKVDLNKCITNEFIDEINDFDHKAVEQEAKAYTLKPENKEKLKAMGLNEYGW
jgi:NitT/TauT family transport system substrate-binding protein